MTCVIAATVISWKQNNSSNVEVLFCL